MKASAFLSNKLKSQKTKASELMTDLVPANEISRDLVAYSKLSWKEECESSTFPPFDSFNHLVDESQIDFIFPSNDADLYALLRSTDFLQNVCIHAPTLDS